MPKRTTVEEFISTLEKINPTIEINPESYTKARDKVSCVCRICNHQWETRARQLISKTPSGCPKCSMKNKGEKATYTHDDFLRKLHLKHPYLKPVTLYEGCNTKITLNCSLCGGTWVVAPRNVLYKTIQGCPTCYTIQQTKTHKEYESEIKTFLKEKELKLVGRYEGINNRIEVACLICDHTWFPTANNLKAGRGCPNCQRIAMTTPYEVIVEKVFDISTTIEILTEKQEYKNMRSKLRLRCMKCENTWSASPSNLIYQHTNCPKCTSSKFENTVGDFLKQYHDVDKHIKFTNLRGVGGGLLSYDYFVKINDRDILIECQGIQHEKPIDIFGGEEQFIIQQEHDRRKREYAKENGYELIEIWYYEDYEEKLQNYNLIAV